MAVKKTTTKKPQVGAVSGRAFTAKPGAVNDSIGRVIWASKINSQIFLENLDDDGNTTLRTPPGQTIVIVQPSNTVDCFYNFLSSVSAYYPLTQDVDGKVSIDSPAITKPAVNIYKIRLANNINCLEVRNNDPYFLTGTDSAPFDFFNSIAITKSEVQAINGLPDLQGLSSVPKHFDLGNPTTVPATGYRTYYQTTLLIKTSTPGSVKGARKKTVSTGIMLYSLDKCNWVSHNYATAAFSLLPAGSPVWNNQTIPNTVVGTNPFDSSIWQALTSKLTTIMSDADNLPTSGDGKGYRLLNTPIRDYIYKGDFDSVTFEIAFRLPFYTENYKVTPYSAQSSGRTNNPYWTKFDSWFGYANGLRSSASYPAGKLLARTGLLQSMTDSIQASPDNASLYTMFDVIKDNVMTSNKVPAFIGSIMGSENAIGPKFDAYFTVPGSVYAKGTRIRTDNNAREAARSELDNNALLSLKNEGKITASSYNSLINAGNTFVAVPVVGGSLDDGYYIFKSAVDGNFYNYDKIDQRYWSGQSGITISYGYDMGGGTYGNINNDTSFDAVTGFYTDGDGQTVLPGMTEITSLQKNIINNGFYKKTGQAVAYFYTYFENVYSVVHVQYPWAVQHIIPFMKHQYFNAGIKSLINTKNNFFKVYIATPNLQFYDPGATQFFNEAEKVAFGTQVYNGGASSFNTLSARLYFTHAVNTHDARWMKEYLKPPKGKKGAPDYIKPNTYVWRRAEIRKLFGKSAVVAHYDFTKASL